MLHTPLEKHVRLVRGTCLLFYFIRLYTWYVVCVSTFFYHIVHINGAYLLNFLKRLYTYMVRVKPTIFLTEVCLTHYFSDGSVSNPLVEGSDRFTLRRAEN